MRWQAGDQIVFYELWGCGIGTARPVTVVSDDQLRIAFYSYPHTTTVTRGLENYGTMSPSEKVGLSIRMLDPTLGEFREELSPPGHVLTLVSRGRWHSVMLFWDADWEFLYWKVNLQSPLRRVRQGVQAHDYILDIIVRPNMSWEWKDVEQFKEMTHRGFLSFEQVSAIHAEANRMAKTIERGGSPLSEGWENWRPVLGRPTPRLPSDWADAELPSCGHWSQCTCGV